MTYLLIFFNRHYKLSFTIIYSRVMLSDLMFYYIKIKVLTPQIQLEFSELYFCQKFPPANLVQSSPDYNYKNKRCVLFFQQQICIDEYSIV
jgi:hypothetical protein